MPAKHLGPKDVVHRLVDEVMNRGNLNVLEDLYSPRLAAAARGWVEPFLASFTDVHMRIVELVAEGETVVGRFACSGTNTGTWLGHPPTGRRFTDVAEVYFFRSSKGASCGRGAWKTLRTGWVNWACRPSGEAGV